MNISQDGISVKEIKLRTFEIMVSLVMMTGVATFLFYWALNLFFASEFNLVMRTLLAAFLALSFTAYFFIKRLLLAFAQDVARRGVTKELNDVRL